MTITVTDIYRYPVKGLSAEPLESVELSASEALPHDRRFAIAHGSTQFDPREPKWLPKIHFLMLMRDEKLAQLRTRFDPESGVLTVERAGKQVLRASPGDTLGRTLIGQFFASFLGPAVRGAPKLVEAPGHTFSDIGDKVISLINLASVRDLERVVRRPVHPLRFRANLYLDGAEPWEEFGWAGKEIAVGEASLRVREPIRRCAATNVDPETAERDLNLPRELERGFGHVNMGVYAVVTAAGTIGRGDRLAAPEP